jgi:hypothetical protein
MAIRTTVHKEHEESQRKKLFASLRELCGHIILFRASQREMKALRKSFAGLLRRRQITSRQEN